MSSSDSSFSAAVCQRSDLHGGPGRLGVQRGKLTLLLLLDLRLLGSATSSGSTTSSSGSGGTATRADGREQVLHILALKSLQCNKCPSQSTYPIPISARPIPNSCAYLLGLRTLANNEAQMGSTSATLAALMRVEILSACGFECQLSAARGGLAPAHLRSGPRGRGRLLTVISTPSSARISAA